MTVFIFENWPDTGTDKALRKAMIRLVDDRYTYYKAIDLAKHSYLQAMCIKMRGKSKREIARRCGFSRNNLSYLMKKHKVG